MIEATERVLSKHNGFLNASDMGTGKTRATAAFCNKYGTTPLVVCPKTLISSWKAEFDLWGLDPLVVNYEKVRGGELPRSELIVWDEAQALSGLKSLQSQLLVKAVGRGSMNILISATLADNPLKLRSPGFALGLHGLKDYWTWAKRHGCLPGEWGGMEFCGRDTYIRSIHRAIFPERGVRIRYADIPEFPECQITPELIDFSADIQKIYRAMEKELVRIPPGVEALDTQLRARQQAELLKVPDLVQMTDDLVSEGKSVCIFVNFVDTARALLERMPYSGFFTGLNTHDREDYVRRFQANEIKVMILTLAAGGPGLNLGDEKGGHQRVSIINPGFRADHVLQAAHRTHRGTSLSPSLVRILFAKDTIEEDVWINVRAKANRISLLNDDDFTFR